MSIADEIIRGEMPDFDYYINQGESLDDIDEYGFTPLIETAITQQYAIAEALLQRKIEIDKPDVTGRTALHWAVDNEDLALSELLLKHGANPNAYTRSGLSVLVYPVLRQQTKLKHLLYQYGAKLDFALDFIHAKSLGHRFELSGTVDILTADEHYIEVDYEGFILEFTIEMIKDSLRRFISSYSTRYLRSYFSSLSMIVDALFVSSDLLKMQSHQFVMNEHRYELAQLINAPLLILPAASRGHALCFIRYHQWWAKIDRGENSKKEGCVNIYHMGKPEVIDVDFIQTFLFKKQNRNFFHQKINKLLELTPIATLPITPQIAGNCSWANIQAMVPVAYALITKFETGSFDSDKAMILFDTWLTWDQDRALNECIQRFYLSPPARQASIASTLAAILFHCCDHANSHDVKRAEQILPILTIPSFRFILDSYLDVFCVNKLTRKGNNLLKLLDDCGVNSNISITPIATGLKRREKN